MMDPLGFDDDRTNVLPVYIGDDRTDEDAFKVCIYFYTHELLYYRRHFYYMYTQQTVLHGQRDTSKTDGTALKNPKNKP